MDPNTIALIISLAKAALDAAPEAITAINTLHAAQASGRDITDTDLDQVRAVMDGLNAKIQAT